MDDDTLDRAIAALPLETPPADLRTRILAATIYRPQSVFRTWEIWAIGTLIALMVWLSFVVLTGMPDAGHRLSDNFTHLVAKNGLLWISNALWVGVGLTSLYWISQLTLMPRPRVTADTRGK